MVEPVDLLGRRRGCRCLSLALSPICASAPSTPFLNRIHQPCTARSPPSPCSPAQHLPLSAPRPWSPGQARREWPPAPSLPHSLGPGGLIRWPHRLPHRASLDSLKANGPVVDARTVLDTVFEGEDVCQSKVLVISQEDVSGTSSHDALIALTPRPLPCPHSRLKLTLTSLSALSFIPRTSHPSLSSHRILLRRRCRSPT